MNLTKFLNIMDAALDNFEAFADEVDFEDINFTDWFEQLYFFIGEVDE